MARTVVCIPTYCEADTIGETLRRTRRAVPDADILVVDDSSPDGTGAVVECVASEVGAVRLLTNDAKKGLGAAYRRAFDLVLREGYDTVAEMDADLSHDPDVLPRLIGAVEGGAALAIGSRYVPGGAIPEWPAHRRALSRYGNKYAAWMLDLRVADITAGFRCYSASTLSAIDVTHTRATGYGFHIECTYRVAQRRLPVVEVPIVFAERTAGRSKLSTRVAVEELLLVTAWGVRDRLRRRGDR